MLIRWRLIIVVLMAILIAACWAVLGRAQAASAAPAGGSFHPPLPPPLSVIRAFSPPGAPWLPGNRGVDLAANTGEPVFAAAEGVVLYAGLLAGRGVVSVRHGDVRTTYEPVDPIVHAGEEVGQDELIGHVSIDSDGCGPPGGCLHWGALRGDVYLDPMSLLGVARVRLLPIWGGDEPPSAPTTRPRFGAGVLPATAASPAVAASPAITVGAARGTPTAQARSPGRSTAVAGVSSGVTAGFGLAVAGGVFFRRRTLR